MTPTRRTFLGGTATAFAALVGGCQSRGSAVPVRTALPYGPLVADPAGILDLPNGFSYRVLSRLGDPLRGGGRVPDKADGMGCIDLGDGRLALIRNHELKPTDDAGGALSSGFDHDDRGRVLPGGTTTLILDAVTLERLDEFRSLAGTIKNCAGGVTPWGSWLTCEEDVTRAGDGVRGDHGWVFEIPAGATGLVDPVPLTAMGRFRHEAATIDPATGIAYLTEDRDDSLFYRFIPTRPGNLAAGGRLQALALITGPQDSRNWSAEAVEAGSWHDVRWIDLDDVESPADDLRQRGAGKGALIIARGEGIEMGEGDVWFTATSGGAAKAGQVFRLSLGESDRLQLFFESTSPGVYDYGDNLTVAPDGHLIVCEDRSGAFAENYLRGLTAEGAVYPLALLRVRTEPAGVCFSPDGRTLFMNVYSPAMTLAVTGPWLWRA